LFFTLHFFKIKSSYQNQKKIRIMHRLRSATTFIAYIFALSCCGGGGGGENSAAGSNTGAGQNSIAVTGGSALLAANQTYVVNAGSVRALLQLPVSSSLKTGDTITVTGQSSGGWKLVQGDGQSILTTSVADSDLIGTAGYTWSSHLAKENWFAAASSANGLHLIAAADDDFIYTSADGGNTWTKRIFQDGLPVGIEWRKVLSSRDGARFFAASVYNGIYRSEDGGETWQSISDAIPSTHWSIDSSADGEVLVASNWPDNQSSDSPYYDSGLEISSDAGKTWNPCKLAICATAKYVAISADGNTIMGSDSTGNIFKSNDQGKNWTTIYSAGTRFSMSADGQVVLAVCNKTGICVSRDGGSTWTSALLSVSNDTWSSVAVTPNGQILAAGTGSGSLYASLDAGKTWKTLVLADGSQPWSSNSGIFSIALSDNGHRIAFGGAQDKVYTSNLTGSRTGINGWLDGEQSGSITLTYQGNGTFSVSAYSGTLTVQ
jgi:photosystem II stability/assembly factor-like uncharacterized protein